MYFCILKHVYDVIIKSSGSLSHLLRYRVENRQTDRQTDRQTNAAEIPTLRLPSAWVTRGSAVVEGLRDAPCHLKILLN